MIIDKGIQIKNIYYMLTYAFQVLKQTNYEEIAAEEFENIQDLFAAILGKGISQQVKQGLYREYRNVEEDIPGLRGKLLMTGTIRHQLQRQQLLSCEHDELTENNLFNQILKTAMVQLIRHPVVKSVHKNMLRTNLMYFQNVDTIDIVGTAFDWRRIRYQRSNQSYRMMLSICRLLWEGKLLTDEKGNYKTANFLNEEQMSHLYEKFILEYYRYHHPEFRANPDTVKWNLDDDHTEFLPGMITDITLKKGSRTLIIDAKYYGHTMQMRSDKQTIHSGNLYQIFAYVKNMDKNQTGNVSGMLLYAKTEEQIQPNNQYSMGGNKIYVRTLDLNMPFEEIKGQLEGIAEILG